MNHGSASMLAAAFHSIGIEAEVLPGSTPESLALAGSYTSGDECLPQRITLGSMLKVMSTPGFMPDRTAFFMPTTHGPCRFGQYSPFFEHVFTTIGCEDVLILAPSTLDGYSALGNDAIEFTRTAWRALVIGDILRGLLLRTRPYEKNGGDADEYYSQSLARMMSAVAKGGASPKTRMRTLIDSLTIVRDNFRRIPVMDPGSKPLIGAVGEIYCRLDDDANDNIIRLIEEYGGEVWLAGVCEWLEYTNEEVLLNLRIRKRGFSFERFVTELRKHIQHSDKQKLESVVRVELKGYEEPATMAEILRRSESYLPSSAVLGEMVINVGRSIYLREKGVDGVVDLSPFTCMNAIVAEAIYPKVSRDQGGLPIKVFYFDGKTRDWSPDVEMFMELVRDYRKRMHA